MIVKSFLGAIEIVKERVGPDFIRNGLKGRRCLIQQGPAILQCLKPLDMPPAVSHPPLHLVAQTGRMKQREIAAIVLMKLPFFFKKIIEERFIFRNVGFHTSSDSLPGVLIRDKNAGAGVYFFL